MPNYYSLKYVTHSHSAPFNLKFSDFSYYERNPLYAIAIQASVFKTTYTTLHYYMMNNFFDTF